MRYQVSENVNVVGRFPTGLLTVTIQVLNLRTGVIEPLTSNTVTESAIPTYYTWPTSNITAQPTQYTDYLYVMTDSASNRQQSGKFVLHGYVENLDATISSVVTAINALNDLSITDVQTALTNQGYTTARALLLDNLDTSIGSVLTAISGLNDLSITDVQTALTNQGYTATRALLLDNLDNSISSVLNAISLLNDISAADVDALLSTNHGAGSWEDTENVATIDNSAEAAQKLRLNALEMLTVQAQNGPHSPTSVRVGIVAPSTQTPNTTVNAYKNGVLLVQNGAGETSRVLILTSQVQGPDIILGIDPSTPFPVTPVDGDNMLLI